MGFDRREDDGCNLIKSKRNYRKQLEYSKNASIKMLIRLKLTTKSELSSPLIKVALFDVPNFEKKLDQEKKY